jgi:type II secretory pathway pseudopilin PulG
VATRAHDETGFGLVELLMAIVLLNVGMLAVLAAFSSGNVALARASRISTASTLANTQMEVYRGLKYEDIVYTTADWNLASADSTYTADTVYQQNMASPPAPKALVASVATCPTTVTTACDPSYTMTGADSKPYRVDTYLYYDEPGGGAQLKTITIVVRDTANLGKSLARISSTFDPRTGV